MSNIVGIDLGTTFSGLAVLNSIGRPEIVPNADGERITPSVVFFTQEEDGKVLLVGGSSRIPLVQARLEKMFGFAPTTAVNVDECVALGAALHAGLRLMDEEPDKVPTSVADGLRDVKLTDVCNHSYGVLAQKADSETGREVLSCDVVIPKGTPIPCSATRTFRTVRDDQCEFSLTITQGEGSDPEFVSNIGELSVELPPGRPSRQPISATFTYDENQRMQCVIKDVASGRRLTFDIDAGHSTARSGPVGKPTTESILHMFQVE